MTRPHRLTRPYVVAFAALSLLIASCSGGGPGTTATTPTNTATAAAADRSGFVAFGDFGGGPMQDEVAAAMEEWVRDHPVQALVTTGDNVYDFGEPELFEAQLDAPYADLRRSRPMWVTLGNHDVARGFEDEQLDHLGLPDLPYAKELAGVQLLFLDANRPDEVQAQWLDQHLVAPGPRFRVVVFHQPAYSCALHGPTPGVVDRWVPVFERHRVALVLAGHDHLYERFVSPGGVTYVVTGGGGRSLYPFREPCQFAEMLAGYAEAFHFVGVEVRGRTLTATAVSAEGEVLDRFEIER